MGKVKDDLVRMPNVGLDRINLFLIVDLVDFVDL
jgi:hypothetical protein